MRFGVSASCDTPVVADENHVPEVAEILETQARSLQRLIDEAQRLKREITQTATRRGAFSREPEMIRRFRRFLLPLDVRALCRRLLRRDPTKLVRRDTHFFGDISDPLAKFSLSVAQCGRNGYRRP